MHIWMKMRQACGKDCRACHPPIKLCVLREAILTRAWMERFFCGARKMHCTALMEERCHLQPIPTMSVLDLRQWICIVSVSVCVSQSVRTSVCAYMWVWCAYMWMCLTQIRLSWLHTAAFQAPSCFRSSLNHGSPHRGLILSDTHRYTLTTFTVSPPPRNVLELAMESREQPDT